MCGCLRERSGAPQLWPTSGRNSRGLGRHWGQIFGFQVGADQLGPGHPHPTARPVSGPHLLAPPAPQLPWTSSPLLHRGTGPAGCAQQGQGGDAPPVGLPAPAAPPRAQDWGQHWHVPGCHTPALSQGGSRGWGLSSGDPATVSEERWNCSAEDGFGCPRGDWTGAPPRLSSQLPDPLLRCQPCSQVSRPLWHGSSPEPQPGPLHAGHQWSPGHR